MKRFVIAGSVAYLIAASCLLYVTWAPTAESAVAPVEKSAQIVCIDTGTVRSGFSEIGDVVSVHDGDVELSGSGYEGFRIIRVEGLSGAELRAVMAAKVPEVTYPEDDRSDEWWDSADGKWKELKNEPKYPLTVVDLTAEDVTDLAKDSTSTTDRSAILNKIGDNVRRIPSNLIEVNR
jgi:hypothetical protein